jgi:hypothetical protein
VHQRHRVHPAEPFCDPTGTHRRSVWPR